MSENSSRKTNSARGRKRKIHDLIIKIHDKKDKFDNTISESESSSNEDLIKFLYVVSNSLKSKQDDDATQIVSNILSTIEGNEIKLIEDVRTNPIMRSIMSRCNLEQLFCFLRVFIASEDSFGHVYNGVESASFLERCFDLILEKLNGESKGLLDFTDLKESICKFIDLIVATKGDELLSKMKVIHLLKKLVAFVIGEKQLARKIHEAEDADYEKNQPKQMKEHVVKLAEWVHNCDVAVLRESPACVAFLVALFNALGAVGAFKTVRILALKCLFQSEETANGESVKSFRELCYDNHSPILIETALNHSKEKLYNRIFKDVSPIIADLSTHRSGNFVVQKLLVNCPNEETASTLVEMLKDHLSNILESGHSNVFTRLLQMCVKFPQLQPEMYSIILDVFKCQNGEANIFELISYFSPSGIFKEGGKPFSAAGSHTIQILFNWTGKPLKQILKSFSNCDDEFIIQACCDKTMSYAIEAFFQSQTIKDEIKRKVLADKILPSLVTIAKDPIGSYLVESMVRNSNSDIQFEIMDGLVVSKNDLQNSKSGFIVTKVLRFHLYQTNREQWVIRMQPK